MLPGSLMLSFVMAAQAQQVIMFSSDATSAPTRRRCTLSYLLRTGMVAGNGRCCLSLAWTTRRHFPQTESGLCSHLSGMDRQTSIAPEEQRVAAQMEFIRAIICHRRKVPRCRKIGLGLRPIP